MLEFYTGRKEQAMKLYNATKFQGFLYLLWPKHMANFEWHTFVYLKVDEKWHLWTYLYDKNNDKKQWLTI